MDINTILKQIDMKKEELFHILSNLVQINSENFTSHGNEMEIAEIIHGLCMEMGLESTIYSPMQMEGFTEHPDYLPNHGLEDRYNVTAVWHGCENKNALMLMAHSDTVQIGDPSKWKLPPLSGAIKDGRIYGRGAGDDKSGIAVMLFLTKILKEAGFVPKHNLVLNAYCDEEYGGSHGALAAVLRTPCDRIVNLDYFEDEVIHVATGGGEMKYHFHAAEPVDSATPVARALSTVMDVLDIFAENRRNELNANRFYADTTIPETAMRYMGVQVGHNGQDLGVGEVHFVFYTDKTKEDIYPEFDMLHELLKEKLTPLGMVSDGFTPSTRFFHYVACEPDCREIMDYLDAAKLVTGKTPNVCGGALSDLSVIAKYGSPNAFNVGCIRNFEKEGGAHQPNEYVECEKLVEFAKIMAVYILKVLQ